MKAVVTLRVQAQHSGRRVAMIRLIKFAGIAQLPPELIKICAGGQIALY